jgi:hypothetical protein
MIDAVRQQVANLQTQLKDIDRRLRHAEASRLPVLPLCKLTLTLDDAASKFRKLAGKLGNHPANGDGENPGP